VYPKSTPLVRLYLNFSMWFIVVVQQVVILHMTATDERLPPADWAMVFLTSAVWLATAAETDVPAIVRKTRILKQQLRVLYGSQYFLAMLFLANHKGLSVPPFLIVGIASGLILISSVVLVRHSLDYIRGLES